MKLLLAVMKDFLENKDLDVIFKNIKKNLNLLQKKKVKILKKNLED